MSLSRTGIRKGGLGEARRRALGESKPRFATFSAWEKLSLVHHFGASHERHRFSLLARDGAVLLFGGSARDPKVLGCSFPFALLHRIPSNY